LDACLLRGAVAVERLLALPKGARIEIILDCTTVEKRGKQMDGLSWLWSNAKKRIVWGHHFVIAAVRMGGFTIPLGIRLWLPEGFFRTPKGKESGRHHQTPLSIAEEFLCRIPDRWRKRYRITVLGDTEFFGGSFPKVCRTLGFTLVSACQRNRQFRPDTQPRTKKNLATYAYGLHYWNERTVRIELGHTTRRFRVAERTGKMKNVGRVKIATSCRADGGSLKTLVSTDPLFSMKEIVFLYAQRWWIEVLIKQLKGLLGLGDYQCLDWRAIEHHAQFTCLAHQQLIFLAVSAARKEGRKPTGEFRLPAISVLQLHLQELRRREHIFQVAARFPNPKTRRRVLALTPRPSLRFDSITRIRSRIEHTLRQAA
jgi:hypothetical protein